MTLTFFTNFVHHHQIPLADEFYKILGVNYRYVAMERLPDWLIKGGYDPNIDRPYILRAYESNEAMNIAKSLMLESDVVIGLYGPKGYAEKRQYANKLTFNYSERWIKKSFMHAIDPRVLMNIYRKYFRFRNKKTFMLCASAFASSDAKKYFCYPKKCYKWGYFPSVELVNRSTENIKSDNIVTIMWCSRFIYWKHPELAVKLAAKLKEKQYNVKIDMYGNGEMYGKIKQMIYDLDVSDIVSLNGNLPNNQIIQQMRNHDIFIFTSDKGEGWGAVLNESMSQGCAVVASNLIGAAPYLINNGNNGLLFKSGDIDSLFKQVKCLLDDSSLRRKISENAIRTMQEIWNPKVAAERLLHLSDRLINGLNTDYSDGPCSLA